jgi:hypothetical protein
MAALYAPEPLEKVASEILTPTAAGDALRHRGGT